MPLQLQPAVYEDMVAISKIERDAFNTGETDGLLFKKIPEGSDLSKHFAERNVTEWKGDASIIYFKVVDPAAPDEIVASAMYNVYTPDRVNLIKHFTAEDVSTVFGDFVNPGPASDFFGTLWAGRERTIGKRPHILLRKLATIPRHQRRGAGGMLVQKGCDMADELELPAVLTASPAGLPIYKKYGYVEKEVVSFDPKRYGKDEGLEKTVCMLREPLVSRKMAP